MRPKKKFTEDLRGKKALEPLRGHECEGTEEQLSPAWKLGAKKETSSWAADNLKIKNRTGTFRADNIRAGVRRTPTTQQPPGACLRKEKTRKSSEEFPIRTRKENIILPTLTIKG